MKHLLDRQAKIEYLKKLASGEITKITDAVLVRIAGMSLFYDTATAQAFNLDQIETMYENPMKVEGVNIETLGAFFKMRNAGGELTASQSEIIEILSHDKEVSRLLKQREDEVKKMIS